MLGIEFQSKYPKESRRITMFLLILVLLCALLGTQFPGLLTQRQKNQKENKNIQKVDSASID